MRFEQSLDHVGHGAILFEPQVFNRGINCRIEVRSRRYFLRVLFLFCHREQDNNIGNICCQWKDMQDRIQLGTNVGYNLHMPVDAEKLSEQILVNVASSTYQVLDDIRIEHDRRLGYVARELMLRGLAQYRRDGLLREPEKGLKMVRVKNEGEITDELQRSRTPAKTTAGKRGKIKAAK